MSSTVEQAVKERAAALGFELCGIVSLTASDDDLARRFDAFIAANRHGDMDWMANTAGRRRNPRSLWPEARSAVMLGLNYGPAADPLQRLAEASIGNVSVYASGKDYHDIFKGKLKQLAGLLSQRTFAEVKVFVDTAPLMEKPLAQKAGLGWQGKHTNLVSRQLGSWLFLGAILTTADLIPDAAETDHCGSCRACLDICPTKAFPAPYQLDARRCISYLTIEHQGHIAREFRAPMGNRIYGCDDCLAVCPWNKYAKAARETRFAARQAVGRPHLSELLALDDAAFRVRFSGSPVKRTGRDRFIRNVLIAAGNSKNKELAPQVEALLQDHSPLVRAMAVWALSMLVEPREFARCKERYAGSEPDDHVRREWHGVAA